MHLVLKEAGAYRESLRTIALNYYHNRYSYIGFLNGMYTQIYAGLTQAWVEGFGKMGIPPEDISTEENLALQLEIEREFSYAYGLGRAIDDLKANEKPASTISRRLDLWGDAYIRVMEMAKTYAGKDAPLEWVLHPAEHCPSCKKLSGKVKRASYWYSKNLYPKSWNLDCRQGCKCSLEPTDKPVSRGTLGSY